MKGCSSQRAHNQRLHLLASNKHPKVFHFASGCDAYMQALKQQKHEPHNRGPTVVTTSSSTVHDILHASSSTSSTNSSSRPPSFGAAPAAAAAATSRAPDISNTSRASHPFDFDVVLCGGTLGICVALALQQKGYRVAVVEKRRVEGRLQEWNSSRHEIQVCLCEFVLDVQCRHPFFIASALH